MRRALLLLIAACSSPRREPVPVPAPVPVPDRAPAADGRDDVVLITEPAALAAIDDGTEMRVRVGAWDDIASVLEADVEKVQKKDRHAGVSVAGHAHRLFDVRWLHEGRFDLIGAVNRLDRAALDGGCGSVRLVYRLADAHSRLPMTLSLVYPVADDGDACRSAAARWRPPAGLDAVAQARWLLADGALAHLAEHPDSVEVNLQQIRWPSAVRPDLGGHAEYLMRAFRRDGEHYAPGPLLDTPDVARLKKDRALRAELLAWIGDHLDAIDAGTAQVPEKFLARSAVSVAPRGLARRANRPYRQLFSVDDVAGLALDGRRTIRSPEALLRRLDDATCTGCHQSRTIAGFHLLGVDPPDALAANALAVPLSGHLLDEQPRRAALVAALAAGEPPDWLRPFAERAGDGDGGWGAHCGLGDAGFAGWTCAAGLHCDRHDTPDDDAAVGVCVPDAPEVGDACEPAPVVPNADSHRDRIARAPERACGDDAVCNQTRVGFPGGMCTADCGALPAHGACGAIAELTPFNNCLARKEPFETCLAEHASPAGLRACDAAQPCRDDYVCVRSPDSTTAGTCIPPYFLFQLRVDGH